MSTERHQIAAQLGDVDGNAADGLRGIEMKNRARLRGGISNRAYFLNGADFRIREREGNQRGIGIDRGGDFVVGGNRPSRSGATFMTTSRESKSLSGARIEECSIDELMT